MAQDFISDGVSVGIPLTRGETAWVDLADAELVLTYRWKVKQQHSHWTKYAIRTGIVLTASGHPTRAMHRLVMDPPPHLEIDHIDGNGLNNRRSNLRLATRAQNITARPRINGYGFRGVIRGARDIGFRSKIVVDGKAINLGTYGSAEEAGRAYDAAALKYHGEFARLNFPVSA